MTSPRLSYQTSVDRTCPYGFSPQIGWDSHCRNCLRSTTDHSSSGRVVQIYDSLKRPSSSRLASPPISNVTCRDYYGPPGSSHYTRPSGTSRYLGRYDSGNRSSWASSTTSPNASRESSLAPTVNGVSSRSNTVERDSSLRSVSPSYRVNPSSSVSSISGRPSVSSAVLDYSYRRSRDIADMKRDYSSPYGRSSITTSSKYVATSSIRPTSPDYVGSSCYSSRSTPVSPRSSRTVSPARTTPSSSTDYYSCRPTSSYLYTKSYNGYGNPSSSSDIYYSLPRPAKRRTTYTSSNYGSPSYTPLSSTTPTRNFQYSSPVASRELSPVSATSPTPSVSAGIISGYRRLTGKTSTTTNESTDYEVGNSEHLSRNAWSKSVPGSPASISPVPPKSSTVPESEEDSSKVSGGSYYLPRSSARYGTQPLDNASNETDKKTHRRLSIGKPDHDLEITGESKVKPVGEITSVKLEGTTIVPNKGLIPLNHFATPEYLSGQQDSPRPEDHGAFLLKKDPSKSEIQVEPKVEEPAMAEKEIIPFQGIQERLKARRSSQINEGLDEEPSEMARAPKLLSPTMSADSGVHSEVMSPPTSRKTSQNGHETGTITPTEACDKLFASQAKIEELQGSLPRSYKSKRPKRPKALELQTASSNELEAMLKGLKGKSPLERIHDFSHSNSDLSCLSLANSLAESQKEIFLSRQKKQEAKELFFFPKSRPFVPDPVITRETNELLQRQDVILEGLKLETEELQAQIRQLEDQLDDTQSQVIDDLQCQIRDLAERLANTQTDCQHLEGTNANLKSEIQNLENELLEAQDHFNEKDYKEWKRLRKDLGAMTKSCRNFQLKLRRSQMKSQELRVVNKELSSNVAHQEQTIHLFRTGILWGSVLLLGYHVWKSWR